MLEVGCSFGHMTEYLAEQPEVAALSTFDTDAAFVEIARTKAKELGLTVVHEILLLDQAATRSLPWADGAFDLVLAVGVVEHLPERHRRAQVDEYWRVLAPGGHIAFLDTPNRCVSASRRTRWVFLSCSGCRPVWRTLRAARPPGTSIGAVSFEDFVADGTGWRNATLAECLPSTGRAGVVDVTEEAGYGFRYFRDTARSRTRRALLPLFGALAGALAAAGQPPSLRAAVPEPPVPARTVRRAARLSMRIEIGHRNYLAYLLLSHPAKIARLSSESRQRLDDINRAFNERIYSGDGAREYDRIHRYAEADQNEANSERLSGPGAGGRDVGGRRLRPGARAGRWQRLLHDADRAPRPLRGRDRAGAGHPAGAGRAVPA